MLLASIIEQVSGKTYGQFLMENFFLSLNITTTRVYHTRRQNNERIDNYAYGYVYSEKLKKYILPDSLPTNNYVVYQDAITGDGTVNSCIRDLQIWENEVLNPKVIDKSIFEKALTNHRLTDSTFINYGYGFFLSGNEPLSYHTGGWPGYTTIVMNFLEKNRQIIIFSNNEYTNFTRLADDISECVLK